MTVRRLLPVAVGVAVVIAIVLTVGGAPFLRGLAAVTPGAIVAAVLLTATSTAAAAFRWCAVAEGFGLPLRWADAVAACYRSQFLNSVLPGGVVGDVHRAYRHGQGSGDLGLAARAVATERSAGQLVQLTLALVLLASLGLTTTLRDMAWVVGAVAIIVAVAVGVALATPRGRRVLRRELELLGRVFADPRRALLVVGGSLVVIASLTTMFVVSCLAAGVRAPLPDLIVLSLVALSAASLPINVAGWGPREAAAASAFAVVGLGSEAGVAASTAFGVLSLIAVAPGAVMLLIDRITASPSASLSPSPIPEESRA